VQFTCAILINFPLRDINTAGGARPGQIMGGTIGPGTEPEDTAGATLEDMKIVLADGDAPGSAIPN
jgi:hypothetical protein